MRQLQGQFTTYVRQVNDVWEGIPRTKNETARAIVLQDRFDYKWSGRLGAGEGELEKKWGSRQDSEISRLGENLWWHGKGDIISVGVPENAWRKKRGECYFGSRGSAVDYLGRQAQAVSRGRAWDKGRQKRKRRQQYTSQKKKKRDTGSCFKSRKGLPGQLGYEMETPRCAQDTDNKPGCKTKGAREFPTPFPSP